MRKYFRLLISTVLLFFGLFVLGERSGFDNAFSQPASRQQPLIISQPAQPDMFPMLGEQNRVFAYWLCSQLIGKLTLGAWSLGGSPDIVDLGNGNSANIQFVWQEGQDQPGLFIYVACYANLPAVYTGQGQINAGGGASSFSFTLATAQEAEGLQRGTIQILELEAGLGGLVEFMFQGEELYIAIPGLNMELSFSLAGFGAAWRQIQFWRDSL